MLNAETFKTARQGWAELSHEFQEDVNLTLEELAVEIAAANAYIADHYILDPDGTTEYAVGAIEFLNKNWHYRGDYFMVSGRWHEPVDQLCNDGVMVMRQKRAIFGPARSNGFTVSIGTSGEGEIPVPRVGMSFNMVNSNASAPGEYRAHSTAFAELSEISLQFMQLGERGIESSRLSEVLEALELADSLLHLYTNHSGSSFYEQSHKRQQRFLDSIVELAESTLPAPDTFEKLVLEATETSTIYMKCLDRPGLIRLNASQDGPAIRVGGQVLGAVVHDQLQFGYGRRYSSPDDMRASELGLSLVVKPYTRNFKIDGYEKSDVLVPLGSLSSLPLSIQ